MIEEWRGQLRPQVARQAARFQDLLHHQGVMHRIDPGGQQQPARLVQPPGQRRQQKGRRQHRRKLGQQGQAQTGPRRRRKPGAARPGRRRPQDAIKRGGDEQGGQSLIGDVVRQAEAHGQEPGQQQAGQRGRAGGCAGPVPAARACRQPGHDGRAGELAQRRALLHPAHRRRDGVFARRDAHRQREQRRRDHAAQHRERQHRRVAQQRRQPFAARARERRGRGQGHRDEAGGQQSRWPHAALQQPPGAEVADHVDRRGQRRQHAGGGSTHARGGVDHRQEADHGQPLARVERETRRHQPGAERGQRALHARQHALRLRLRGGRGRALGHAAPQRQCHQAGECAERQPPHPPAEGGDAQRPDQQGQRRAQRHVGAPQAQHHAQAFGCDEAADQPRRGQHHHQEAEALDRA